MTEESVVDCPACGSRLTVDTGRRRIVGPNRSPIEFFDAPLIILGAC